MPSRNNLATMMQVICMLLLIPSSVMMVEETRCAYPSYLQGVSWNDVSANHNVQYQNGTLKTHQSLFHAQIDWHCFSSSREDKSDLVISKAIIFGLMFFRCELYHEADQDHVYYKSLTDPIHVVEPQNCNICNNTDTDSVDLLQIHRLENVNGFSPNPTTVQNWGCIATTCNECPASPARALEEDTSALKDEARSLEYLLRKWLADKRQED